MPGLPRGIRSARKELLLSATVLFGGAILIAVAALVLVLPLLDSLVQAALAVAVIVALDLAIVFAFFRSLLSRSVFDPLRRIGEHAEVIAGGEYGHRIPHEEGEELDRLTHSVNTMAERLISDQRKLADNVRSLDQTNQELVETTEELVRAARMASVGTLAGGLAHEVGNPLGALRGYLDVARKRAAKGGDVDTPLAAAVDEAGRIDRIVRSVLDFAGPGRDGDDAPGSDRADPSEAVFSSVDVSEVVERALSLLEGRGVLTDARVECVGAGEPHLARAQPQPVEQILLNLVMNALQAAGEAGDPRVWVRVSTEAAVGLRPRARRDGDPPGVDYTHRRRIPLLAAGESARHAAPPPEGARDVVLRVEDNGPGIRAEHLPRIFDPFFTTREPGKGTGLGLALTARLVQAMGGRIDVENREEGGARFTVRLPERADEPVRAGVVQ